MDALSVINKAVNKRLEEQYPAFLDDLFARAVTDSQYVIEHLIKIRKTVEEYKVSTPSKILMHVNKAQDLEFSYLATIYLNSLEALGYINGSGGPRVSIFNYSSRKHVDILLEEFVRAAKELTPVISRYQRIYSRRYYSNTKRLYKNNNEVRCG